MKVEEDCSWGREVWNLHLAFIQEKSRTLIELV
jgi:hypothetical protein